MDERTKENKELNFFTNSSHVFYPSIEVQKQAVVSKLVHMFKGRDNDLDRLLVQTGIPSEDLKDPDKREGL